MHNPISALVLTLVATVAAQDGFPVIEPRTFDRGVDPAITRAMRTVVVDMTGELLHDVATLWEDGSVIVSAAPEVMTACAALPVTGVTDIAAVLPRSPGQPGALLAVVAGGLVLVQYDGAGFVQTPLQVPGWGPLARIEARRVDYDNVLLLAASTDNVNVFCGGFAFPGPLTVAPIGSMTAGGAVLQFGFHEVQVDGAGDILLRTPTGLEAHALGGATLATWATPAGSTGGPFTPLPRADTYDRLAWMLHSASGWTVRVLGRSGLVQDLALDLQPWAPLDFALLSIGSGDIDGDGSSDLVLHQASAGQDGPWQFVLLNAEGATPFSADTGRRFAVAGVTAIDVAAVCVFDVNNSGSADTVIVTSSPPGVHLTTGFRTALGNGPMQVDDEYPDPVVEGEFILGNYTVRLVLNVPGQYSQWQTEVVTWHQTVVQPRDEGGNFGAEFVEASGHRELFDAAQGSVQLAAPFATHVEAGGIWHESDHYYLQIRYVVIAQGAVIASSPARLVGLVSHTEYTGDDPPPYLNYLRSISSPSLPPAYPEEIRIEGRLPKNVGHVKQPQRLDPPFPGIPD